MTGIFPKQFADLEEIAGPWATEPQENPYRCGVARSSRDAIAFYRAVAPRAGEILEYCKAFDARNPPSQVRALLNVVYALLVASSYVDESKGPRGRTVAGSSGPRRQRSTRSSRTGRI